MRTSSTLLIIAGLAGLRRARRAVGDARLARRADEGAVPALLPTVRRRVPRRRIDRSVMHVVRRVPRRETGVILLDLAGRFHHSLVRFQRASILPYLTRRSQCGK